MKTKGTVHLGQVTPIPVHVYHDGGSQIIKLLDHTDNPVLTALFGDTMPWAQDGLVYIGAAPTDMVIIEQDDYGYADVWSF